MLPFLIADGSKHGSVTLFAQAILRQERLCDALEALADSLPHKVDTYAAAELADDLVPTLRQCQLLEEKTVFPPLLAAGSIPAETLARLRAEHLEDEDHAAGLSDTMIAFARHPAGSDAEGLGYGLRGLFQPLRRHTAFDRGVILPMYRAAVGG